MVITNNVQGDEPCTATIEWQVQTLVAAVEFLTQQNHDLEEQLCQKNARLNTQEEDQEDTSTERKDHERLEGSNVLSRPKRQDTSRPSAVDMVPHQIMKERMDFMINALRGCGI